MRFKPGFPVEGATDCLRFAPLAVVEEIDGFKTPVTTENLNEYKTR